MKIHFINVGYGDSILIECEQGGKPFIILVDGGTAKLEHYAKPKRITTLEFIKQIGATKIDILIVTHLHEDHVGGILDVARHYPIAELWCGLAPLKEFEGIKLAYNHSFSTEICGLITTLNSYLDICNHVSLNGKVVEINDSMPTIMAAQNLSIKCLNPDFKIQALLKKYIYSVYSERESAGRCLPHLNKLFEFANSTSIVLKLVCHEKTVLLGADADISFWNRMTDTGICLKSNLLKLPHHGRADAITKKAANCINPGFVVLSTSNDCTDDCPSFMALDRFKPQTQILFTDGTQISSFVCSPHNAITFEISQNSISYSFLN